MSFSVLKEFFFFFCVYLVMLSIIFFFNLEMNSFIVTSSTILWLLVHVLIILYIAFDLIYMHLERGEK